MLYYSASFYKINFMHQDLTSSLPSCLGKKPLHVGVIMDGNGRWGVRKRGYRSYGHQKASQAVLEIISGCVEQEIHYLTLYAFSVENWERPSEEITTIFQLVTQFAQEHLDDLKENNIKFRVVGDSSRLPRNCWDILEHTMEATKCHTGLHLTVALNYGGRAETVAASEAMAQDFLLKVIREFMDQGFTNESCFGSFVEFAHSYRVKITPVVYEQYLYTSALPNVDLVIRTGGKKRMSNFLPWQSAYAELYFTDLFWPDFKKEHLLDALAYFQQQHRTFGRVGGCGSSS